MPHWVFFVMPGGLNAETGSDREGYESCLSPRGLGARNSQFFIDFAKSRRLGNGDPPVPKIDFT